MRRNLSDSMLSVIGNTPLVRLDRLTAGLSGMILAKLEFLSPGLSKKDRVALKMIEDAEHRGMLKRGQPVVELTSGNMGTGLAIVCRLKGYPFIAVMSRGNSIERAQMMRAFGAEVVLVDQAPNAIPGQVSGEDLERVEREAKRLTHLYGAFRADQFQNPSTMDVGEMGIGAEIIDQLGDLRPNLFVDFMGTGGSFIGVSKALKKHFPDIVCMGIEPENAAFYGGGGPLDGRHRIQGGGYSQRLHFVEHNKDLIDGFVTVADDDARWAARQLAAKECIFAGYSSGANAAAALNLLKKPYAGHTVVILMPDSGTKYLSTDLWPAE